MEMRVEARVSRASQRWQRLPRVLAVGVLVVIAVALVTNLVVFVLQHQPLPVLLALIVAGLGVGAGTQIPYLGLVPVAAASLIVAADGQDPTGVWSIAVLFAFFLTLRGTSGLLVGPIVGAANFATVALYHNVVSFSWPTALVACFSGLLGAAIGSTLWTQAAYFRELEGRARDAVASRAAAVERGIAQERVRIARDLHDSIGHHIAVVNMRLGAAEVQLPATATGALTEIVAARDAVKSVLQETQEILSVLRDDAGRSEPGSPATHQAVPDLVASFRDAGLDVDTELSGLDGDLPAATSAAVYRIVQEILTNAHRYSAGVLSLHVNITTGEVMIRAANPRRATEATESSGGGRGLVGVRERAASVGGTLQLRDEGDVWWLQVTLPRSEQR